MLALDTAYVYTKFDYSSFSHSRGMVGAHQNLNGSRDLTTPLSGWFAIHGHLLQSTYLSKLKSLSPVSTHYKDMKNNKKMSKNENGVAWGSQGSLVSLEIAPFDLALTNFY